MANDPAPAEYWHHFAESVSDYAFVYLDRNGLIAHCNRAAERMLGYTAREVIGRAGALFFVAEDRQAGVPEQELATALRDGRAEDERWHLRKDGARFRASGTLTPVRGSGSEVIGFAKVMRDVTARENAREQLERSVRERSSLLREVQHRVKNNLQMIVSLIRLQADRTHNPDTHSSLRETQNRVRAIAAIHERLYASDDFATVHIGPYLQNLARDLTNAYECGEGSVQVEAADLALDIGHALPVALITNELICNAFKHAFPAGRCGQITVTLKYGHDPDETRSGSTAELKISDNGMGLPEGIDLFTADSMGFDLVRILARQIRATIAVETSPNGTSFRVIIPLDEPVGSG